jgi:hypothetical protein
MNSYGTAFPSSNATFGPSTGAVEAGHGFGGDPGRGFHSTQPIDVGDNDHTEKTHFKDKKNAEPDHTLPFVPSYPAWHESPFTRYVPNVLSSGGLPPAVIDFQPEDRSKMGIPLNPFWIRNDRWAMKHEADIFVDAGPNFVAPSVGVKGPQHKQGFRRHTYLDNEVHPQVSEKAADIKLEQKEAPAAPTAGSVTSTGGKAVQEGEMAMEKANPAKTHNEELPKKKRGRPSGTKKEKETVPQIIE